MNLNYIAEAWLNGLKKMFVFLNYFLWKLYCLNQKKYMFI